MFVPCQNKVSSRSRERMRTLINYAKAEVCGKRQFILPAFLTVVLFAVKQWKSLQLSDDRIGSRSTLGTNKQCADIIQCMLKELKTHPSIQTYDTINDFVLAGTNKSVRSLSVKQYTSKRGILLNIRPNGGYCSIYVQTGDMADTCTQYQIT